MAALAALCGNGAPGFGGGGGGAGLGGAIFNAGTFTVRNSTFTNNFVVEARTCSGANGADAGGAIFSFFGSLTVVNSTVA